MKRAKPPRLSSVHSNENVSDFTSQSEDIFLDMFEDEYSEIKKRPLNVEWLMMDSNILLPPTGTPMTGIEFTKRLPCGEVGTREKHDGHRLSNAKARG